MEIGLLVLFVYWMLVKLNGGKTKFDRTADQFGKSYDESRKKVFDPYDDSARRLF
jgi:hypothetical protein